MGAYAHGASSPTTRRAQKINLSPILHGSSPRPAKSKSNATASRTSSSVAPARNNRQEIYDDSEASQHSSSVTGSDEYSDEESDAVRKSAARSTGRARPPSRKRQSSISLSDDEYNNEEEEEPDYTSESESESDASDSDSDNLRRTNKQIRKKESRASNNVALDFSSRKNLPLSDHNRFILQQAKQRQQAAVAQQNRKSRSSRSSRSSRTKETIRSSRSSRTSPTPKSTTTNNYRSKVRDAGSVITDQSDVDAQEDERSYRRPVLLRKSKTYYDSELSEQSQDSQDSYNSYIREDDTDESDDYSRDGSGSESGSEDGDRRGRMEQDEESDERWRRDTRQGRSSTSVRPSALVRRPSSPTRSGSARSSTGVPFRNNDDSVDQWRTRRDPTVNYNEPDDVDEENEFNNHDDQSKEFTEEEHSLPPRSAKDKSRTFSIGNTSIVPKTRSSPFLQQPTNHARSSSLTKSQEAQLTGTTNGKTASAPAAVVKAVLKPYQRRVVETMKRQDVHGLIVAHSLGHGKTLTAIAVADWFLKNTGPEGKVIVISPKSVLKNFREEKILKFDGIAPEPSKYIFVTKQTFSRGLLNRVANSNTLLIIDEAHNYRTSFVGASGKEVVAALDCASRAAKVLLLTGTPVYNRPSDICNLVAMAKGEVKPLSSQQFDLVCSSDESLQMYLTLPNTDPPASVFDLHLPIASSSDYPEEHNRIIRVPMPTSLYRTYRMIEQQNHPMYNQDSPWIFLNGVRQAMNQIEGYAWSPKIDTAFRLTKEAYDRKQRVLLYSAFLDKGVFLLQQKLAENNMLFSRITGEETVEERRLAVRTYNEREGSILIVSRAGGEGLNLMATRVVILLESGWNEPGERQVIGRAIRYRSHSHLPASERFVTVYRLLLVKPEFTDRDLDDNPEANKTAKESADEIVHHHNQIKALVCNDFMERVKGLVLHNDQSSAALSAASSSNTSILSSRSSRSTSSPHSSSKVQITIEEDD